MITLIISIIILPQFYLIMTKYVIVSHFQIYLNNKAQIDPVLDQVKAKIDEVSEKVFAMIPKGKAAAEKKEE